MRTISLLATKPKSGGGGGTDEHPGFPGIELRSHGIVVIVFGFAFGLASFFAYYILSFTKTAIVDHVGIQPSLSTELITAIDQLLDASLATALLFFVGGLVFGTMLAGLYNVLIFRRLNLFGIDRTLD